MKQERTSQKVSKTRPQNSTARVRELEAKVKELQTTLQRRYPNSIPALISAIEHGGGDDMELLRDKVKRLEVQLTEREEEKRRNIASWQQQFQEMEVRPRTQTLLLRDPNPY